MLKRKITSKLPIILICALLFTSCGASKSTNASSTPDYVQSSPTPAASAASMAPGQSTTMKYGNSIVSDEQMAPAPSIASTPGYNTEEYKEIDEKGFASPIIQPLSTFSIDVDTASYANVRRFLLDGQQVPPDAVRIEELINYFGYNYPKPDGETPFSVYTEMSACPWNSGNKLLLIGLQGEEVDTSYIPPSNLVFLLDVSGSMQDENKLPLVKQSFLLLLDNLRPYDRISIVTYAGNESVLLRGVSGDNKLEISRAIQNLEAGGSTAGASGIQTAYKIAIENYIEGGNNRVILATDGDFNVGVSSESDLTSLIEEKRDEGVFLSVLGFGTGNIKDNKMETLASNGNGNYAYIDSILEAKKVLVDQMGGTLLTIAKDVKLQVEFNPGAVKGYRLVGYDNRMLNAEDFNNDAKDAGEMGAGHRVTALYEIIPAGSSTEVAGGDLKYQQTQATGSDEWLTIQIRYKQPDQDQSQLLSCVVTGNQEAYGVSENFAFASGVAEFGLLLRGSEYRGNASYEDVYGRIAGLSCVKEDQYKTEFLGMVKMLME